jgi:hypothetical protein
VPETIYFVSPDEVPGLGNGIAAQYFDLEVFVVNVDRIFLPLLVGSLPTSTQAW